MTRRVQFYDPATGLFDPRGYSGPQRRVADSTPPGLAAFDVTDAPGFNWRLRRVDLATAELVDYEPPTPAATELETWALDPVTGRHVATLTVAGHWRNVRAERDRRLAACDWVVARSSERGEPVPLDWTVYRQALRDITQQDDPLAIRWPEPPA